MFLTNGIPSANKNVNSAPLPKLIMLFIRLDDDLTPTSLLYFSSHNSRILSSVSSSTLISSTAFAFGSNFALGLCLRI